MPRRASEVARQAAALQASQRMIARGERPGYRIRTAEDGRWIIDALPWLSLTATRRNDALGEARTAIAEWLAVRADAFDVEA